MGYRSALLAFSAAVLASTASVAADLPARTYTKAPVYAPAPIFNWTGIYVGAHIGAAFGGDNGYATTLPGLTGSNREAAFLGGGQLGADYQFAPNWLVGIEGQISGLSGSDRTFSNGIDSFRDRSDWLASITGRLGYTWGPGLIYAKGGVAFRDDNGLAATAGFLPAVASRESTGYTVGGGLEYMFAPAWSAKVEYQYYNFDTTNVAFTTVGPVAQALSYKDDLHTVKVGVNYRFNWGGPVVAKY
ncbi:porin family protein [Afipia massiliensis]|uniref:Porin family protein n=1 Tax=Afipia massiliensis TaxID=211460 RepID=A0A4U6BM99_9BRAD|nr:outer membrane beta-barrel protein [Afipia massiliensis]TKT71439.1 porin family protein [Afipia massiliensis]